ncbi:MAG: paraquat-inducible protein A [Hyphomicrobiaceae bacterium]|nr:paraquat-inducible protein A [Hyphomicrobiaceae bacterium]
MMLGGRRFLLGCAIAAAGASLALAFSMPFARVGRPALFAYEHSLISAVEALVAAGQLFLAGVVLLFAIFLPLLKLLHLLLLASLPSGELRRSAAQLRAIDWLGRWSSLDVFAFGLTLTLMLGHDTFAQRSARGAYFFLATVAAMLLAYAWLRGDASARRMRAPTQAAAYASTLRGVPFGVVLALAALCLGLGITLPAVQLASSYAGSKVHSLASLITACLTHGERFLGAVVLMLAVVLPAMRLIHLATLVVSRALPHGLRGPAILAAEVLGRYAMADTMVLALMLFQLIASGDAQAGPQPGVYCFIAAALFTMLAYAWANLLAPTAVGPVSSLKARLAGVASGDKPRA